MWPRTSASLAESLSFLFKDPPSISRAMSEAKAMGYTSIVLDTLPTMHTAKSLYVNYGFKQIPAYYENPESGVEYYRYVFSQHTIAADGASISPLNHDAEP